MATELNPWFRRAAKGGRLESESGIMAGSDEESPASERRIGKTWRLLIGKPLRLTNCRSGPVSLLHSIQSHRSAAKFSSQQ